MVMITSLSAATSAGVHTTCAHPRGELAPGFFVAAADGHGVSGLEQVERHPLSHDAEADESDMFFRHAVPSLRLKCALRFIIVSSENGRGEPSLGYNGKKERVRFIEKEE